MLQGNDSCCLKTKAQEVGALYTIPLTVPPTSFSVHPHPRNPSYSCDRSLKYQETGRLIPKSWTVADHIVSPGNPGQRWTAASEGLRPGPGPTAVRVHVVQVGQDPYCFPPAGSIRRQRGDGFCPRSPPSTEGGLEVPSSLASRLFA